MRSRVRTKKVQTYANAAEIPTVSMYCPVLQGSKHHEDPIISF